VALLATWAAPPALVCDPRRGRRLLRRLGLGLGRLLLARNSYPVSGFNALADMLLLNLNSADCKLLC